MRVLDLFSGIGGFSLGLERAGMTTVAFCEREPFCQQVLAKHWPGVPVHDDITTLDGTQYRGAVDLVCGGFPCQPFSVAGKRAGKDDDRHLWPEMCRVIGEVGPTWIIGENVPGLIGMELDAVLSDLETLGYSCGAFVIPACAVDAPHRRDRLWIIANSDSFRCGQDRNETPGELPHYSERISSQGECVGHDEQFRAGGDGGQRTDENAELRVGQVERDTPRVGRLIKPVQRNGVGWPKAEPFLCGGAHGIPDRVDRLKALGNAVVPQVVEQIGRMIMEQAA